MAAVVTPPVPGAPPGTAPAGTPAGTLPPGAMPMTPAGGTQPQQGHSSGGDDAGKSLHQKGRGKIPWSKEVWDRIDQAVEMEVKRTRVGARFLPKRPVPPKTTSVPTDAYTFNRDGATPILTVDEGAMTPMGEAYVEYLMSAQQVDQEQGDFNQMGHGTAVTLATKAANTLAQAEDLVIFQGLNAINGSPLFTNNLVLTLAANRPTNTGLLNFPVGANSPGANPAVTVIQVNPLNPAVGGVIYGPNTFEGTSQAYSALQAAGHYGPYALVLETIPYADTYAPLPATLTLTADRIKPLMTSGFFGTGTLPPMPPAPVAPYYGVMVSLGGNTMDLVVGLEPIVAFMQEDTNGSFRFRVLERFALRIKDLTSIVVLQFN